MPADPIPRTGIRRYLRRVPAPLKRAPAAAALGNASLLGIGYLILGRRLTAAVAAAASVALVIVLAAVDPPAWPWRAALLLWWITTMVHAWLLARGRVGRPGPAGPPAPRRRVLAATIGAFVIALAVLTGVDARWIGARADAAHEAGECAAAAEAGERFWTAHKVVDGSIAAHLDEGSEACAVLLRALDTAASDPLAASEHLAAYIADPAARWDGAADLRSELMVEAAAERFEAAPEEGHPAVEAAFELLAEVVASAPDRAEQARALVDDFLTTYPETADSCRVKDATDWLGESPPAAADFEAAAAVAADLAPDAILGCADSLMSESRWGQAGEAYAQLVAEYPDHESADRARDGAELAEVRSRLGGWPATDMLYDVPAYCDDPVPYSGAPDYSGSGPHRMAVFGMAEAIDLPASWQAEDITEAALVVCVGDIADTAEGSVVDTCRYEGGHEVDVHARQFPMTAFALRTGEVVYSGDFEIGGDCPPEIFLDEDGTKEHNRVAIDDEDVREAFEELANL
ncbi:hypothetical protein [Glycomyces buryatensis]|uniref:Tetratricopeptide repeat protein n=1 Tax=Glycomyces buryatensis TaxID=2570927 RepID=A0A4S8QGB5_9ACTN|nr:hypothetical protein [Glycomyces buryatensis]THV42751.1 hypothetical protein FAB82_04705 [Glycomyces buryatensis]